MRFGIRHVELILDQLPDAAACPNRVGIAELGRVFFEKAFEFCELFAVELGRLPRAWLRCKGVDALLVANFPPKWNGRKTTAEHGDNLVIAVPLFDQLTAVNPTVLSFR